MRSALLLLTAGVAATGAAGTAATTVTFTPVQLWRCAADVAASATQSWRLNATGLPAGAARVTLAGAPLASSVWDLNGPSNKSGTEIHLYRPYTNAAQEWHYSTATGQLSSPTFARGMCAAALYPVAGALLVLEPCSASSALQAFTLDNATGALTLRSDASLCVDAGSATNCSVPPTSSFPFCDTGAAPAVRAADLAQRMQTEELAFFLGNNNVGVPSLGVPRLGYGEALHGLLRNCLATPMQNSTGCPTSFPHLLLLSGSFNRSLWRSVAHAIGDEGRAYFNLANRSSHLVSWAPDINPFRDPRWGRGQEVAGEDPLLLAEFIAQYAVGMQEDDPRFIKFVSTAKHWSLYDFENGTDASGTYYIRNNFTAAASRQMAVQYYWPPFLSATQRGGVKSIMCSYNSVCLDCDPAFINHTGTPSCADAELQNTMVRGEWGWDGFIVSDCDAIGNIFSPHAFTPSAQLAAVAGMLGGTDVDCGTTYSAHLAAAVANASLPRAALVTAAQRVLTTAFGLGIYDPIGSVPYDAIPPSRLDSADNRALSLEGAVQGMVLLANSPTRTPWGQQQPLLPLRLPSLARLAVIGPLANATQTLLSNYEGGNTLVEGHSIWAALAARARAAGVAATLTPGCINATGGTTVWCQEGGGIPAAAAAAAAADVAVVVVGLCSTCPLDGWRLEGEGHDRSVLTLPGQQEALVAAVLATGTPVVVVLVHGGPLAIEGIKGTVPAILDAHYPGQLGGEAVAAVLLGDVSPSGRLTTTYYTADIVHRRAITDMNIAPHGSSPGLTHLYVPEAEALWPFGFGLSYTTFAFAPCTSASGSQLTTRQLLAAPPTYSCNVTNTGTVASSVSVLGMLSSGVPGEPLQELFDFARVADLGPGDTATVQLTLPPGIAAAVTGAGDRVLRAGEYQVRAGEPGNWAVTQLRVVGEEVGISAQEGALGALGAAARRRA